VVGSSGFGQWADGAGTSALVGPLDPRLVTFRALFGSTAQRFLQAVVARLVSGDVLVAALRRF